MGSYSITAVNRRLQPNAESMVARHLRRRTSSKPIVGHRAAFNEEAVDHRCANAGSTALTQRCFSILCYLGTASAAFTAWPEYSQIYFLL